MNTILGQDMAAILFKALELPENTVGFDLHCYVNKRVSVDCFYYPEYAAIAEGLTMMVRKYELHERTRMNQEG